MQTIFGAPGLKRKSNSRYATQNAQDSQLSNASQQEQPARWRKAAINVLLRTYYAIQQYRAERTCSLDVPCTSEEVAGFNLSLNMQLIHVYKLFGKQQKGASQILIYAAPTRRYSSSASRSFAQTDIAMSIC
ncbi:hypothetical protein EPA93_22465 [Ktedonosporobacter rubrisoli]|uniref:Uncharacterized protein n=1 Tax=Ktedonosporobacter rubrisoli TaxID=2509675 RepID=A0A4P6JUI3_KTERU|nr:hypothetical protein [Ktedonosporobacter rubrisoli]QBD78606.1 hypothetical protein EPA93_22465 [Ktedonosporobacter rubrisoli]